MYFRLDHRSVSHLRRRVPALLLGLLSAVFVLDRFHALALELRFHEVCCLRPSHDGHHHFEFGLSGQPCHPNELGMASLRRPHDR
jgi:hypothetical protein